MSNGDSADDDVVHGGGVTASGSFRPATECPDSETLAAFIDGTLPLAARAAVTTHVAGCDSCREVYAATVAFQFPDASTGANEDVMSTTLTAGTARTTTRETRPAPAVSRGWPIAALLAAAALVLASGLTLWWWASSAARSADADLSALVAAVGTSRPIEARLTGGFAHGPWLGATRAGESRPSWDLLAAAGRLQAQARAQRSAVSLHHLASTHLLVGESDRAIALLNEALALAPDDAGILSDLSAAYLTRATMSTHPEDLPLGLAAAERALRQASPPLEARFNRALVLEHLPLDTEALKAWDDYLAHDTRSPWADEARRRREALAAKLGLRGALVTPRDRARQLTQGQDAAALDRGARAHAQALRELFEEEVLPGWAAAVLAGDPVVAAARLEEGRRIGHALRAAGGDALAFETITALTDRTDAPWQRDIAQALAAFDTGRRQYDADAFAEARPTLQAAAHDLEHAGLPFAARARFQYGLTLFYARALDDAAKAFEATIQTSRAHGYTALLGRGLWVRGLMRAMPAGFDARLLDYQGALTAFTQAGEAAHVASVHALLSETYELYGDDRQAWTHRRAALAGLGTVTDARRRHIILLDAARASLQQGLPEAAAHFDNALLASAHASGRPTAIVESYRERARTALALGQLEAAAKDIAEAGTWLTRITDPGMAARSEPFVLATDAEITLRRDPARARDLIARAMANHRSGGRGHYLPRLWLLEARSWLAEQRAGEAVRALDAGIEEIEHQRIDLTDPSMRRAYLDESWELFRTMIEVQTVTLGHADRGLYFAERGRARTLLDRRQDDAPDTGIAQDLRARLPPRTTALVFIVLTDRTLVWTLSRDTQQFASLALERPRLRQDVSAYLAAIEARDAARTTAVGRQLADALLTPVARALAAHDSLVIVPDDALLSIPFAALPFSTPGATPFSTPAREIASIEARPGAGASNEGRPTDAVLARPATSEPLLGDTHRLTMAPSLSAYLALSSDTRPAFDTRTRVLTVTSSAADERVAALPFAQHESREIDHLYADAQTLDVAQAPKGALLAALDASDVVHIALHATASARVEPYLLLSTRAEPPADRILTVAEVERLRLRRPAVIVLAACKTARGTDSHGEGALSLAWAFLAAGAPHVVATLWDVDDRPARELLTRFHRQLAHGESPEASLAQAQRALRADPDPALHAARSWAGFVLVGARPRHAPPPERARLARIVP